MNVCCRLRRGNSIRRDGVSHGSTVLPATSQASALPTAGVARVFHYCQVIGLGQLVASRSSPRTVWHFSSNCGVPYGFVCLWLLRCLFFDSGVLSYMRVVYRTGYVSKKCLLWMRRRRYDREWSECCPISQALDREPESLRGILYSTQRGRRRLRNANSN